LEVRGQTGAAEKIALNGPAEEGQMIEIGTSLICFPWCPCRGIGGQQCLCDRMDGFSDPS
jgi:hypothetical protein